MRMSEKLQQFEKEVRLLDRKFKVDIISLGKKFGIGKDNLLSEVLWLTSRNLCSALVYVVPTEECTDKAEFAIKCQEFLSDYVSEILKTIMTDVSLEFYDVLSSGEIKKEVAQKLAKELFAASEDE